MAGIYTQKRRFLFKRFEPVLENPQLTKPFGKWLFWVALLAFFVAFLIQAPGNLVFDTKIDLVINPKDLLESLWYLWDPLRYFGVLQDQYQGYAWPMGPFFLAAKSVGLPEWIAQRLWMALVESVAFWSLIRLEEALEIGRRETRLLTGLMFALWPTFTMLVGSTSGAILPGILIPLVTTPLVKAAKGAPPLKSAIISAAAVGCMGGINATVTFEGLIIPVMFLLTRQPGSRLWVIIKWWVVCVLAAICWWLIPLLFLGHYGFNFLPYIETAKTTTSTMSATEVLRGAGYWTGYLDFGFLPKSDLEVLAGGGNPNPALDFSKPWIEAGWIIATNPLAILAGCILAAISLYGLARKDMPERTWLLSCFTVGFVFATAGYWGTLGGPFSPVILKALDGTLAPLRNVYKVEPEMAVCLCLGFCHTISILEQNLRVIWNPRWLIRRNQIISLATLALIVPLSLPYITGNILQGGSFKAIPNYWYQLAKYLQGVSPYNPVLVVPAQDQGVFSWGTTVDEPLEPLGKSPWVALNQVPFSGAGVRRFLDFVENQFASGNPIPNLSSFLERAGITYIVADNDTDWKQSASPSPAQVHQVLNESGYVKVAGFGPLIPSQDYLTLAEGDALPLKPPKYQAVEVFAPESVLNQAIPTYPVTDFNLSSAVVLSGGPGVIGNLVAQGLISPQNPVILSGQIPSYLKLNNHPLLTSNSLELRHINFGLLNLNKSYVLLKNQLAPLNSPGGQGGNPPKQILPFSADSHQSYSSFIGIKNVTASSYGSWYYTYPQYAPFNAVIDGSLDPWITGTPGSPVGQWIKIDFTNKVNLGSLIYVSLLVNDVPSRPYPTALTVTTQNGSITTAISKTESYQPLSVPTGKTNFLKITIASVKNYTALGPGVGILSIKIPGINPIRYLKLPADFKTNSAQVITINSNPFNPLYSTGLYYPSINSEFYLEKSESLLPTGQAMVLPTQSSIDLTDGAGPVNISASSTFENLPMFAPINLLNPSHSGLWMANSTTATLKLSWLSPITFNHIKFFFSKYFASYPKEIELQTPSSSEFATLDNDGVATFNNLTTNTLTIKIIKTYKEIGINQLTGYQQVLPVGLTGIEIPGLKNLEAQSYSSNSSFTLSCSQGPKIKIDNNIYSTSVTGNKQDLLYGLPVILNLCTKELNLTKGSHFVQALASSSFFPTSLNLIPVNYPLFIYNQTEINQPTRQVQVINWGNETRSLQIGPGKQAILEIHEDANLGWAATLNGQSLKPITVDGFQQGFLIPSGPGGLIVINYYPNFLYRLTFGGSLFALGILFLFALSEIFFSRPHRKEEQNLPPLTPRKALSSKSWFFLSLGAVFFSGGVAVFITLIISFIIWRHLTWKKFDIAPWIALITTILAGIIAASSPGLNAQQGIGTFSVYAQLLSLCAVSALITTGVNWPAPILSAIAPVVYSYRRLRYRQKLKSKKKELKEE
jgi:arabinofuranan 3-O-arabinosyltransferase